LVQGDKQELEFDNFDYWIERFSKYPVVQLIDLDAARGVGDNRPLIRQIMRRLKCQVGGGIRTVDNARDFLEAGAHRVILGSALMKDGKINHEHARNLADALGAPRLVFALDSKGGRVAIDGWRRQTAVTAFDIIPALEPYCETFLYTHIDTEGLMQGIPMDTVRALRDATSHRLVVAGGVTEQREIDELDAIGIDAVVGMALYTGRIAG
jgi:phosphoribosylformimino-5-aminoimidazole carboxamide ribotide isomerase